MKKKIFTLTALLICMTLSACGQDIAKEASEKGMGYFDSGDYETAAKAFALAIEHGNQDKEINLLYNITLGYYQANKAYEEKDYAKALEIINGIDKEYANYGIKEKILTLQNNINKAMEAEVLLDDVAAKVMAKDYAGAIISAEKIDITLLSPEQTDRLNEYKTNITLGQQEEQKAKEEEEKKAEEAAKAKAEQKKNNTTKKPVKPTQNTVTSSKPVQKVETPVPVTPAINVNVGSGEYIYPSDTTLLTREVLSTLGKNDLALLRNEIYARKGHIFDTSKYINYFSQKTWYTPTAKIGWADLNQTERDNIKLIKEFESKF